MKIHEVEDYLRKNGMKAIGGGSKYAYWSFFDHLYGYSIRAGMRNIVVVYRQYTEMQRGYPKMTDTKATNEIYYGKLTELMLDKMMEVAQQPPRQMTIMKATILDGIKKRKKVDRELTRDFAVTLSATADRIADREGEDDYRVERMRHRAEELFKLMDEDKPRLYEVRCHIVGTYC